MKTGNEICLHSLVEDLEDRLFDATQAKQVEIASTIQGVIEMIMSEHDMQRCEFCRSPEEGEFLHSHDFGDLCENCEAEYMGERKHRAALTSDLRKEGNGII